MTRFEGSPGKAGRGGRVQPLINSPPARPSASRLGVLPRRRGLLCANTWAGPLSTYCHRGPPRPAPPAACSAQPIGRVGRAKARERRMAQGQQGGAGKEKKVTATERKLGSEEKPASHSD